MARKKSKEDDNRNILVPVLIAIIVLLLAVIILLGIKEEKLEHEKYQTDNNIQENQTDTTTNTKNISRDDAIDIALKNVGASESDIYDLSIEEDYKYGQQVYEIDFNYNHYEYEYYINAETGNIVHSFKERD